MKENQFVVLLIIELSGKIYNDRSSHSEHFFCAIDRISHLVLMLANSFSLSNSMRVALSLPFTIPSAKHEY